MNGEFEKMLRQMVMDIIKDELVKLTREEIKAIIDELKPDIDEIVSKRVKEHFVALAAATQKHFSSKGDS